MNNEEFFENLLKYNTESELLQFIQNIDNEYYKSIIRNKISFYETIKKQIFTTLSESDIEFYNMLSKANTREELSSLAKQLKSEKASKTYICEVVDKLKRLY
jgi:hypothetical protein